jgi:hypothetical protein
MTRRLALLMAIALVVATLTAGALHAVRSRRAAFDEARRAEARTLAATQTGAAAALKNLEAQKADLERQVDALERLQHAPPVQRYLAAAAASGGLQALDIRGDRVEITVVDEKALDRFVAALEEDGFVAKATRLPPPESSPRAVRASVVVTRPGTTAR